MNRSTMAVDGQALTDIRSMARPLRTADDLDPLLDRIGDARLVLLGEASHGTDEYYHWRAALSRRLIAEHGFSFVAVEGDWPDCFRINRWVKNVADPGLSARGVLGEFARWPRWMWANEEVAGFVDWLHDHNASTGADVGFYGLDVYSLWESMHVVIDYLTSEHPYALDAAREAWSCFEPYAEDPQAYAYATRLVPASCEDEVVELLAELRRHAGTPDEDPEAVLNARQNAEVLVGAERYYRAMVRADAQSWNIRDHHMADTLDRLLAQHGPAGKAIVWEHNTHVGDARATSMARNGMVNVGQLARERHADLGVVLVGFAGHHGGVIAADAWGESPRRLPVPSAPDGSHEQLLHDALGEPSLLVFPAADSQPAWLTETRGHRAIGVVYHPETDRRGNWVPTVMGRRYDALCSFDSTEALRPLLREPAQRGVEQETYPAGQ